MRKILLFLTCAVATFAQRADLPKFYNQADNPVNVGSADFKAVMNYFAENGVPLPQVTSEVVSIPTAGPIYTDIELIWTEPGKAPLKAQCHIVMNSPRLGIIAYQMWKGGPVNPPAEFAPKPVAPLPPPPPVVVSHPGYKRVEIPTPFGPQVYWVKE